MGHPIFTSGAMQPQGGTSRNRFPMNVRMALANPDEALLELDRADSRDSLLDFTRIHWASLEPKRRLVTGWALDAIVDHLEAVEQGHIKKLLVNVPPGFMKSMSTSVFFPAWVWGPRGKPDWRFICASYSQALTLRDNRRCRQLIADPHYQALWGHEFRIVPDQDTKGKFENDKRGWKLATSVGGLGTGERGDVFIIDDPHNIKDGESEKIRQTTLQWFTEVVPTRVNDADESIFIVIMQRVHKEDVSGLILAKELGYDHLCLPMEYESNHPYRSSTYLKFEDPREEDGELLWPGRFSATAVDTLKKSLRAWGGSYAEAGQLQQNPVPRGGGMFKRKYWRFYRTPANDVFGDVCPRPAECYDGPAVEMPRDLDWMILSVDAAFKDKATSSRVSHLVLGGAGPYVFVIDNVTEHQDFLKTVRTIYYRDPETNEEEGLLEKYKGRCNGALIEDKANGSAVINVLRQHVAGVVPVNPEGGKQSRASAIVLAVKSGHVLLPDGAPWLEEFVSEFADFPVGKYNDQVDSLSQGMIYMTENLDEMRAMWMSKL